MHCRGGACPSRHCTGGKCGPMLKRQWPPSLSLRGRSAPVAISGRHSQPVQAAVKMEKAEIWGVAALTAQPLAALPPYGCAVSAATDAIGAYRFHGGLYKSAVPSRDCHVGLWPPRNDKSGTVSILSLPNTNRQHCTGRGMPLPYSALREAMGKTPLSTLNSRRPAGGYPRTGISSNPGRAPMPRRGSDCSRPDCAPRPPRATARCPAAGSARPTGRNTSRFP